MTSMRLKVVHNGSILIIVRGYLVVGIEQVKAPPGVQHAFTPVRRGLHGPSVDVLFAVAYSPEAIDWALEHRTT